MKKILFFVVIGMMMLIPTPQASAQNSDTQTDLITRNNRPAPDFSKGVLNEQILWYFGRVSAPEISPDGSNMLYGVTYYDYQKNKGNTELYVQSGATPIQITTTPSSEVQAVWRPDGKKIGFLFVADGTMQVFECNPDGTGRTQLTHAESDINGFSYSPDGKHILYTRNVQLDPTITDRYADLPQANAMIYDDLMYRHWDSWADGSYAHLFIAPYDQPDNAIELLKGERFHSPVPPFGGMEDAVWSPDGQKIAYCCKRATGKDFAVSTNTDIFIYDLATGTTTNLTEGNLGYDMNPVWSPDGSKLVWWSMETDGFESDQKRMMLHDFKSNTTHMLVGGDDSPLNPESFVWSPDGKKIYFLSSYQGTNQIFVWQTRSEKKKETITEVKILTNGNHDYNSLAWANGKLIVTKTTHQLPAEIYAVDPNSGAETQLTFINKEYLDKIDMGKTEKRWVKTTDGKEMLVWVIYPPKFDPNKKYPALLYCEGGPQSPVSQFFSYRWNFSMMAAHDYIVVAPNRRGLPGFGKEWNDEISGDYGGQCMKDYLSAIDEVAKEPYVDENRLGAVGASFGGYSVYWLAGNHNKRFKALIAHCGMFNFESWYGTTEELFFANHDIEGNYWDKRPNSYNFSPNRFVGNWDCPILVIHGGNDFRIPYTEGMQAFDIAQMKGIPSRFLFFPEETHFVLKPQNAFLWQREFFRFLDEYLKK